MQIAYIYHDKKSATAAARVQSVMECMRITACAACKAGYVKRPGKLRTFNFVIVFSFSHIAGNIFLYMFLQKGQLENAFKKIQTLFRAATGLSMTKGSLKGSPL